MKKTPNIKRRTSNSECGSAVLRLDVGLRLVERSGSARCWMLGVCRLDENCCRRNNGGRTINH